MVPLADSTIYEMEQRGEFPGRFALSPAALSGILPRSKLGWRAVARPPSNGQNIRMYDSGKPGLSKRRIKFEQRHRGGHQNRDALFSHDPSISDVRPFLQHMAVA